MTARTHDAIAFASLVTFASYFPPEFLNIPTLFAGLIGNVVGALIPDMDQATNRLWDLLPGGDYLGKVFKNIFLQHRTLSHSLLGVYLIYRLIDWILPKIFISDFINPSLLLLSIMIGYISHLLADSFTEEGLPLFFPLRFKIGFPPISSWRIKTGGWFEKYVVLPGIGVYLFWFIANNQASLRNLLGLVTK